MRRLLRPLVWPSMVPGALVLGPALAAIALTDGKTITHPSLGYLVPGIAAAGLLLAWRYSRDRLAVAILMVLAAYRLATPDPAAAWERYAADAVATLLPANLLLLSLLKDRGLLTVRGILLLLLLPLQALSAWGAFRVWGADAAGWLAHPLVPALGPRWHELPQPALAAFVLAALLLVLRLAFRRDAFTAAIVWCLTGSLLAFRSAVPTLGGAASLLFAAAAAVLLLGLVESLHALAYRDTLTGLPGRRALAESLQGVGRRYTVAMVDVDHFKKVNDRHGHDVGDQVLQMVASRLAAVSGGGKAFRYGGEEFAVLFRGRGLEKAVPHLEALRKAVATGPFSIRQRPGAGDRRGKKRPGRSRTRRLRVTVSVGAAEPPRAGLAPERVIAAADKALYRAKRRGRNQVQT